MSSMYSFRGLALCWHTSLAHWCFNSSYIKAIKMLPIFTQIFWEQEQCCTMHYIDIHQSYFSGVIEILENFENWWTCQHSAVDILSLLTKKKNYTAVCCQFIFSANRNQKESTNNHKFCTIRGPFLCRFPV